MDLLVIVDDSGSANQLAVIEFCQNLLEQGLTGLVATGSGSVQLLSDDGLRHSFSNWGGGCFNPNPVSRLVSQHPYLQPICVTDGQLPESALKSLRNSMIVVDYHAQTITHENAGPIEEDSLVERLMKALPCLALPSHG